MSGLGEARVEALARRLCTGVPDVECDHIEGVLPSCVRDAQALAPLVAEWLTEAWDEAERQGETFERAQWHWQARNLAALIALTGSAERPERPGNPYRGGAR